MDFMVTWLPRRPPPASIRQAVVPAQVLQLFSLCVGLPGVALTLHSGCNCVDHHGWGNIVSVYPLHCYSVAFIKLCVKAL